MVQVDSEMKIRILQAAKSLFAKQGFDGTSIRQICEEAGANVALVSYYFGGKEKVYQEIFSEFLIVRKQLDIGDNWKDPVEGMRRMIMEITHFQMNDPELAAIIHQEFATNSPRTLFVREMTLPVWSKMRELLEQGQRQGKFHFEALNHTLLFTMGAVLGLKKRVNWQQLMSEPEPSREQMTEHMIHFIMRALGVEVDVNPGN